MAASHASLNNARALRDTIADISAEATPRAAASRSMVCGTHDGSFRFPLFGTGAR